MDNNLIAAILVGKSKEYIECAEKELRRLNVPEGYKFEIVVSKYNGNIGECYQNGMRESSAKYKLYIPPSSHVANVDLLNDVLNIFNENKNIGLIGVVGGISLSTTGRLENTPYLYGCIDYYSGEMWEGVKPKYAYKEVKVISDDIIITQYDIGWRVDLFHGDNCWGISQAIEMKRLGLYTVVPRQDNPWIKTSEEHIGTVEEVEVILKNYSGDIYPLVSIVIPSYRPEFLEISLKSVVEQTYRNLDIFISDDSDTNDAVHLIESEYQHEDRITLVKQEGFKCADNIFYCFHYNNPNAQYVKWVMDDDVLEVDCIAKQMEYFQFFPDVTLVTSARKRIDINGNILPDIPLTKRIVEKTTKFSGTIFADAMLINIANSIGEFTTALCRKNAMFDGYKIGFDGECPDYYFMCDIATWLYLLTKGDLIYISEVLSYNRVHKGQLTVGSSGRFASHIAWLRCIEWGIKHKLLLTKEDNVVKCIDKWIDNVEAELLNTSSDFMESGYRKDLVKLLTFVKKYWKNKDFREFESEFNYALIEE